MRRAGGGIVLLIEFWMEGMVPETNPNLTLWAFFKCWHAPEEA
jgi:hypothetical protein